MANGITLKEHDDTIAGPVTEPKRTSKNGRHHGGPFEEGMQ